MLVFGFDRSGISEVDFYALAHDGFAVEDLADADGGGFFEERDDDAAEGLEGCPGVDGRRGVYEVFDGL